MALTTYPFSVGATYDCPVLIIGIKYIVRNIKIRMISCIILMIFYLLFSRMNLRHGTEAGLTNACLLYS